MHIDTRYFGIIAKKTPTGFRAVIHAFGLWVTLCGYRHPFSVHIVKAERCGYAKSA